jgi:histidine ammonia-lyase
MTHPARAIIFGDAPPKVGDVVAVARERAVIAVDPSAEARVQAARAVVERYAASEVPVYGLTTGLGAGVDTKLSADDLVAFQRRTVPARAVGVGAPAATEVVRAMMTVRAGGMAAGGSGVSLPVFRALVAAINAGLHPIVPSLGSIGAGDLAPLAHMAYGLMGGGEAEFGGQVMPASDALAAAGLAPLDLGPKDGHALLVANAFSVGRACLVLADIQRLTAWIEAGAALNFEAFRANVSVLDDRALAARPAFGQRLAAAHVRALLAGSTLWQDGAARRVQDPLSYRCVPQVFGALLHATEEALTATEIELASSGDNPVVLAQDGLILSHGNFDMTAFVLAWERLGQALAHVATGTAYRCLKIMSPGFSDLPRFLTPLGASRTGFATVQKTISAMEAEIRHLALPISLSPLPAADGVEDQASMAPSVIAKTADILDRLRYLAAIELIASAQAVDLRGVADQLGTGTKAAYAFVRGNVPALDEDRAQGFDFDLLAAAIQDSDMLAPPG